MAASLVFLITPLAVRFFPIIGDLEDLELGDEELRLRGTSNAGVKGRVGETPAGCSSWMKES